ncbi:hypothetical protein [Pseudoalteromonas fenneropenaei]|uniref:hypothetical protein n=1 Tax=Pseudoalteromonas fenneropenaei TaxID=1737459 RepID=UPI00366C69EF
MSMASELGEHVENPVIIRVSAGANEYALAVLQAAFSSQRQAVVFQAVQNIPTQDRAMRLLGKRDGIDVFWAVTSKEREKLGKAVLIPIEKGLIGYRYIVTRKNQPLALRDLMALRKYSVGLREDWPDQEVFSANGFDVFSFAKDADEFEMLDSGRFDILPLDIFSKDLITAHPQLQIAPHTIIYYPSAVYFFVANEASALHQMLSKGMEQIVQNGTLDSLLNAHYGVLLTELALAEKVKINLTNPLLPATAPLWRKEMWQSSTH